jgi:hypothetical protein
VFLRKVKDFRRVTSLKFDSSIEVFEAVHGDDELQKAIFIRTLTSDLSADLQGC